MSSTVKEIQRIAIVDDDEEDIEMLLETIAALKFPGEVVSFNDSSNFLRYIASMEAGRLPDVVIVDYNMPIVNGIEVLRKIKSSRLFGSTRVIIFSTTTRESERNEVYGLGAEFFTKPSSYPQLQNFIASVISPAKA